MKITSQEEYGLRILILLAQTKGELSINTIKEKEGLSHANVAKICRILRLNNIIKSTKGLSGGYELAKAANEITVKEILATLGAPLYGENFCDKFNGDIKICTHSTSCSLRSLWQILQSGIDKITSKLTLDDLLPVHQSDK